MSLDAFAALFRRATADVSLRGATVYVSAALYGELMPHQRTWLWRRALDARASLVTDGNADAPIRVLPAVGGRSALPAAAA